VTAVAARSGRHPEEVATLLYGPARGAGPSGTETGATASGPVAEPADDAALIRLADEIDRLEREVRGR
jgi:hypothetical protein